MEAQQGGRCLPVFALATAFDDDRAASVAAGMDSFLIKPLDRRQLIEALAGMSAAASLAAQLAYNLRSATCSTRWLSSFFKMRSARWRVGRMLSCRLTRLMRRQIEVAASIASSSDNVA